MHTDTYVDRDMCTWQAVNKLRDRAVPNVLEI